MIRREVTHVCFYCRRSGLQKRFFVYLRNLAKKFKLSVQGFGAFMARAIMSFEWLKFASS
jgi:hypothetical protein